MAIPKLVSADSRTPAKPCAGFFCGNSDIAAWSRTTQEWLVMASMAVDRAAAHLVTQGKEATDEQKRLMAEIQEWTMPQSGDGPWLAQLDDVDFADLPWLVSKYSHVADDDLVAMMTRQLANVRKEMLLLQSSVGISLVERTGATEEDEKEEARWKWDDWAKAAVAVLVGGFLAREVITRE